MQVAVIGLGLIGGSIGIAARERLGARVIGWDPDGAAVAAARERQAIDAAAGDVAAAVSEADLVFAAAPVGVLAGVVRDALAAAPADCAVTDVGSTKRAVIVNDPRFCGGHPLAGAETAGVRHARGDLFEGAVWYLTPTARTSGVILERLHRTVAAFGARPLSIDASTHDRLMAGTSHLPHVLANVLVGQASAALAGHSLPPSGPSFRDATRVAGANSAIWTDIYLSNRDVLAERIEDAVSRLTSVAELLRSGDRAALTAWNEAAAADRRALLEAGLEGGPVHELRASVPNRPGVIAELALALGRAGVNIVDMALSPSADFRQGSVSLWVSGDEHAARAEELVGGLGFPVARA